MREFPRNEVINFLVLIIDKWTNAEYKRNAHNFTSFCCSFFCLNVINSICYSKSNCFLLDSFYLFWFLFSLLVRSRYDAAKAKLKKKFFNLFFVVFVRLWHHNVFVFRIIDNNDFKLEKSACFIQRIETGCV